MHASAILPMSKVDLAQKRVVIRADLNVPVKDGLVTSDARIVASLPTIQLALETAASVTVIYLGRPSEGHRDMEFSLRPVADRLSELLQMDVPVVGDIESLAGGQGPMLLENIRFFEGEKANDDVLAQRLANQCDVFVMDAFGTAHRAHASTHGIAKFAPVACAGLILEAELAALQDALASPAKPMLAIVGGAKVSTKLEVLNSLATIADQLLVGGGIATPSLQQQVMGWVSHCTNRISSTLLGRLRKESQFHCLKMSWWPPTLTPLQWLRYVALIRWARTK